MWEIFEVLCNQKGVSVNAVAKATGIAQTTLANWKKRRNILNAKAAQKIADYFGVSLQYLVTGQDTGATEVVVPAERVARDVAVLLHDNPVLIEMIYDFADIDMEHEQRLKGYYDAIMRYETRRG